MSKNSILACAKNDATEIAVESIFQYLFSRKTTKESHVLLSEIFPDEYQIRSTIGGLETSLGTKLWERLATRLAEYGKFTPLDAKKSIQKPANKIIKIEQFKDQWHNNVNDGTTKVSIADYLVNFENEFPNIPKPRQFKKLIKGEGVDVFLRKGKTDYAFDIKTVQWNAGGGPKFHQNLLSWATYWKLSNLNDKFEGYFAIPYGDSKTWWSNFGSRAKPLSRAEVLVGDEFWSMLTGKPETYKAILAGFKDLSENSKLLKVFRDCLINPPGSFEADLIRLVRNLNLKTPNPIGRIDRRKILDWECLFCGSSISNRVSSIIRFESSCNLCASK